MLYPQSRDCLVNIALPHPQDFPPVMHLAVHLQNGQKVCFTSEKINNLQKTILLVFFEFCKTDSFTAKFHCTMYGRTTQQEKAGKSEPGHPDVKKDQVLGRVYVIDPNNTQVITKASQNVSTDTFQIVQLLVTF